MNEDRLDEMWASLSPGDKEYLVRRHVLTGPEARELLDISSARLSKLVQKGMLCTVKRTRYSTMFLRDDIEKRKAQVGTGHSEGRNI